VKKCFSGRMCRLDDIYAELLKDGTEELYRILSNIVNQCLNGYQWKMVYISSIHKKEESKRNQQLSRNFKYNESEYNYGRILSGLIEKEYSNLEEEEQSGFRAGRFCIDNISMYYNIDL